MRGKVKPYSGVSDFSNILKQRERVIIVEKSIRKLVAEAGMNPEVVEMMEDQQVRDVAKSLGIDVPREIEIREHKGAMYIVTEPVEVPRVNARGECVKGKTTVTRGLFLRVEALDQQLEDLQRAKRLLTGGSEA